MKLSTAVQSALGGFALIMSSSHQTTALLSKKTIKANSPKSGSLHEQQLQQEKRRLQMDQEPILSYTPLTQVTDAAAIDLDQLALDSLVEMRTTEGMEQGLAIYSNGANSKSYAMLTLDSPLDPSIEIQLDKGTVVRGAALLGEAGAAEVRGSLMEPVVAGATYLLVQYETRDEQANHVGCQVGANIDPKMDGCFAPAGRITLGSTGDSVNLNVDYTYDPFMDNKNGRSLQSFSTQAKTNMYDCGNCPYDTYQKFYDYYSNFDYGNKWILAAFNRGATNFANGNADFSSYGSDLNGVIEAIHKGTVFLNVFMQVVKSMEDALDNCQAGCEFDGCNDGKANSWDEAVAYYVGSIAKMTNGANGDFLYSEANKRCWNFRTCSASREAAVNVEIMKQFQLGQTSLIMQQCSEARDAKNRIVEMMTVPLIQGTLRFAYLMGKNGVAETRADATGATYAASVLPLVHSCSPVDAQIIYSNMRVGMTGPPNFDDVKAAFERSYNCLGLTCVDVGGIVTGNGGYAMGAEPCVDTEVPETSVGGMTMNATASAIFSPIFAPNTTTEAQESTAVVTIEPEQSCPPCKSSLDGSDTAAAKSTFECPDLLAQHSSLIAQNCECACFVDSKYAFCAQSEIIYSGNGQLVGPCQIGLYSQSPTGSPTAAPSGSPTAAPTGPPTVGELETDDTEALGTNRTFVSEENNEAEDQVTQDINSDVDPETPSISLVQTDTSASSTFLFLGPFPAVFLSVIVMS